MLDQLGIEPKEVLATERFYLSSPLFISLSVENSFFKYLKTILCEVIKYYSSPFHKACMQIFNFK